MKTLSWKAFHERCGRERLQGKGGATAADVADFVLRGLGWEGATQEQLARAISMSTGIIADEVVKHWGEIEAALEKTGDFHKRQDGSWCLNSRRRAKRMSL